jgi:Ca2+-binding RTX toxin-like protein
MTATANGATVEGGELTFDNTGASTVNYTALAATIAAKTTAAAPVADYVFSASAGALTVNVGEYVTTGDTTDSTGSFITANKATSLVVNVATGKTTAATPLELTKFGGVINANAAKSIAINADGLIGATVNAAAATSATITNTATNVTLNNVDAALVLTKGTGTASKLETLTVTSNSDFVTTGSDVGTIQNATITMNNGGFNVSAAAALGSIANLTVAGAGTSSTLGQSAADFGNLGGTNNYNMNVTATGMKGGLNIGKMTVAAGYDINANVAGVTGNVVLGASNVLVDGTTTALAKNVTIEANGAGATAAATGGAKTVNIGSIVASGAVTVNAATLNNVTLGAIDAGETGAVNVNLSGAGGVVRIGTFTGNSVNVNAADTIGGVGGTSAGDNTFGVTAKTSADIAVSSLLASTVTVGSSATSTGLAVKVTGGSLADTVTVTGNAASTSLDLTGDLGLGTDSVTVNGTGYTGSATQTISVAGLSNYDASVLNGSTKKDVIVGGSGADVITGGTGQDVLTGGAGADVFWFNAGNSSTTAPDTITDFGTTDIIKWGGTNSIAFATTVSGSAVTIANNVISFVTPVTTLAGAVSAVNTGLADTDGLAAFFAFGGNTYLFIEDGAGSNEVLIQLTGTTVASSATAVTSGTTGLTGFGA